MSNFGCPIFRFHGFSLPMSSPVFSPFQNEPKCYSYEPKELVCLMNCKVNPSKQCLFPTHVQCHLLLFACSVVGKMKKNNLLLNGGFVMVLYPGEKDEKKHIASKPNKS